MTLCNMSIEAGARAGLIAAEATTLAYCETRAQAPKGADWERAKNEWEHLYSDDDAAFDTEVRIDITALSPQVTWGTSPEMVTDMTGWVPDLGSIGDHAKRTSYLRGCNGVRPAFSKDLPSHGRHGPSPMNSHSLAQACEHDCGACPAPRRC
jgi:homoaconitase/3-isopropylmalate dehydratase large subunit